MRFVERFAARLEREAVERDPPGTASDPVPRLENEYVPAGARQRVRTGEAGQTGPDDDDP